MKVHDYGFIVVFPENKDTCSQCKKPWEYFIFDKNKPCFEIFCDECYWKYTKELLHNNQPPTPPAGE